MLAATPASDLSACPAPDYHDDGALTCTAAAAPPPKPSLEARWRLNGQLLVLKSRGDYAGAISSMVYRGQEYLNGAEHGYLLQGAVGFDGGAECLNPTQAGARTDSAGRTSSLLLHARVGPAVYETATRMAFWTPPGHTCTDARGRRDFAWNDQTLSDTVYIQKLTPNYQGHWNAISDQVTLVIARPHREAGFEAVTAYTPPAFTAFHDFDPATGRLRPDPSLVAHSAERPVPLVLSTADGGQALAIMSLRADGDPAYAGFHNADVGKWSLVFHWPQGLAAGRHRFASVLVFGSRTEVAHTLGEIARTQRQQRDTALVLGLLAATAAVVALVVLLGRRRRGEPTPLGG